MKPTCGYKTLGGEVCNQESDHSRHVHDPRQWTDLSNHPYQPRVEAAKEKELEQFKTVLQSELYDFLRHECMDIFNLLSDGRISSKKAAEAIAERKLGFIPNLPAATPETGLSARASHPFPDCPEMNCGDTRECKRKGICRHHYREAIPASQEETK